MHYLGFVIVDQPTKEAVDKAMNEHKGRGPIMRKSYQLTPFEFKVFQRLAPFPGVAFSFWKRVADARGLDYKTIISNGQNFTALPVGHEKHWCWPIALKCKKKPAYVDA